VLALGCSCSSRLHNTGRQLSLAITLQAGFTTGCQCAYPLGHHLLQATEAREQEKEV
jgi:hypothetical protein